MLLHLFAEAVIEGGPKPILEKERRLSKKLNTSHSLSAEGLENGYQSQALNRRLLSTESPTLDFHITHSLIYQHPHL